MTRRPTWCAVLALLLLAAAPPSASAQGADFVEDESTVDDSIDLTIRAADSEFDTPPPPTFREMLVGPAPPAPAESTSEPQTSPSLFSSGQRNVLAGLLIGVGAVIYLLLEYYFDVDV